MKLFRNLPFIKNFFRRKNKPKRIYSGLDSDRRKVNLLYFPIRTFFRAIAKTQHQEIQALGVENIPADGAVFLVGNHPNSYLDFFNLSTVIRHPIATAAKDVITNLPFIGPILKNYALLIPVSRAQDKKETGISEEERIKANEIMIENAVNTLVMGRLFNIYGEGRSTDSRKLNKIKLGFMALALEAEKQFDFQLNLRIVPYGYFYDRINKFQSSVCIVFGKPFKIKDFYKIPEDFQELSHSQKRSHEKKMMVAGKQKLKSEIEQLIISIENDKLIELIDEATGLYVKSPHKYMGAFSNVREKYILSKYVAVSIQNADKEEKGRELVYRLKKILSEYRRKLSVSHMSDVQIRQYYSFTMVCRHLFSFIRGIFYLPLIMFGFFINYLPRLAGRIARYRVIEIQKKEKVDGDEQAIIAALITVLILYPVFAYLFFYGASNYLLVELSSLLASFHFFIIAQFIKHNIINLSVLIMIFSVYIMARLWRFSLKYGRGLKHSLFFLKDAVWEPFRKKRLRHLRELRHSVIDTLDFIIGDHS